MEEKIAQYCNTTPGGPSIAPPPFERSTSQAPVIDDVSSNRPAPSPTHVHTRSHSFTPKLTSKLSAPRFLPPSPKSLSLPSTSTIILIGSRNYSWYRFSVQIPRPVTLPFGAPSWLQKVWKCVNSTAVATVESWVQIVKDGDVGLKNRLRNELDGNSNKPIGLSPDALYSSQTRVICKLREEKQRSMEVELIAPSCSGTRSRSMWQASWPMCIPSRSKLLHLYHKILE
ncbi:hypothetical protein F5880DRAFT_1619580 [Lentinula raphanica]|nr:hypothetical protein F5880DRAFT_1619580 [Lentinula raphanica]